MINLPSTVKISLRSLRVNKMRSALTMLGIIIGVAAVITMLAVGRGASNKISEQIVGSRQQPDHRHPRLDNFQRNSPGQRLIPESDPRRRRRH